MKKYIKASAYTKNKIATSKDGMFTLISEEGVGREDTSWKGLAIIGNDLAEKHVVEIRMITKGSPEFNGEPVKYKYDGVYVAHGMRSVMDTLKDTEEYIQVLQSALDFAKGMDKYISWWNEDILG